MSCPACSPACVTPACLEIIRTSCRPEPPARLAALHPPAAAEKYGEVVAAAVVLNEQGKQMPDIGEWARRSVLACLGFWCQAMPCCTHPAPPTSPLYNNYLTRPVCSPCFVAEEDIKRVVGQRLSAFKASRGAVAGGVPALLSWVLRVPSLGC